MQPAAEQAHIAPQQQHSAQPFVQSIGAAHSAAQPAHAGQQGWQPQPFATAPQSQPLQQAGAPPWQPPAQPAAPFVAQSGPSNSLHAPWQPPASAAWQPPAAQSAPHTGAPWHPAPAPAQAAAVGAPAHPAWSPQQKPQPFQPSAVHPQATPQRWQPPAQRAVAAPAVPHQHPQPYAAPPQVSPSAPQQHMPQLPALPQAPVDAHAPRTTRDALISSAGRPPVRRVAFAVGGRVAVIDHTSPTYDVPDPRIALCTLTSAHGVAARSATPAAPAKAPAQASVLKAITEWPGPFSERAPNASKLAASIAARAATADAASKRALAVLWRLLGVMTKHKGCLVGHDPSDGNGGGGASAAVLRVLTEAFGDGVDKSASGSARLKPGSAMTPPAVEAAAAAKAAEAALLAGDKEGALRIAMQARVCFIEAAILRSQCAFKAHLSSRMAAHRSSCIIQVAPNTLYGGLRV